MVGSEAKLFVKPVAKCDLPDWQRRLDVTSENGGTVGSAVSWAEAEALCAGREALGVRSDGSTFPMLWGGACACIGACTSGRTCIAFPFGKPCDGCGRRLTPQYLILGLLRCAHCIADEVTSPAKLYGPIVEAIRDRLARGESTSTVQLARYMRREFSELGAMIEAMQKDGLIRIGELGWELTEPVKFALQRATEVPAEPETRQGSVLKFYVAKEPKS